MQVLQLYDDPLVKRPPQPRETETAHRAPLIFALDMPFLLAMARRAESMQFTEDIRARADP